MTPLNLPDTAWLSRTLLSSPLPLEILDLLQDLMAPWVPSYFLSNKIPLPHLMSHWRLLFWGPGLTDIVTGTRESYLQEMKIQLIKVLFGLRSSDNIIHSAFKGATEIWNRAQRTCLAPRFFPEFWNLLFECRIHFIPEMCCLSTPHHVIHVRHSR